MSRIVKHIECHCPICVKKLERSIYPNSIRQIRKNLGMSCPKIARLVELSNDYVYKIDRGEISLDSVSHGNLQKIAAALGVEVDDLFIKSKAA